MATKNYVAIIGKPVTGEMVDQWVSVDDMVSVLSMTELSNGALCGNSIKFDEICVDVDCMAVAGIVIIEEKDGEQQADLRFRQFPVTSPWCERDGQFCISTCIHIADDCCPVKEVVEKPHPLCIDWCARWYELQCKYDKLFDPMTVNLTGHGRSKTIKPISDKMCEKLEAAIRLAKNKCLACKGIRQGSSMFRRIPRRQFKR